jgi:hypothetical protein
MTRRTSERGRTGAAAVQLADGPGDGSRRAELYLFAQGTRREDEGMNGESAWRRYRILR